MLGGAGEFLDEELDFDLACEEGVSVPFWPFGYEFQGFVHVWGPVEGFLSF